jgi:hypothetical protein
MDAKGKLVAHSHDDFVGLVPFVLAQMRKNPAMLVCNHERPRLFSFRTTSFNPDQTASTAQTLISTSPIGNATSLIVSSVMSVGTLDDFFGHDTQIIPSCFSLSSESRSAAVRRALSVEKM